MQAMKFFIDTHHQHSKTFPAGISKPQFAAFFAEFDHACREEGVVILRAHVGFDDGCAYCFSMAPSAEHVRRAHKKAGLPFESISEVTTTTPGDMFLRADV